MVSYYCVYVLFFNTTDYEDPSLIPRLHLRVDLTHFVAEVLVY